MSDAPLISHTIRIAGQSYPVKLTEEEKKIAAEVEKELNEKINEFRIKYTVDNSRDILSMLLISYAFELKATGQEPSMLEAGQRLEKLADQVAAHLKS